MGSSSSNPEESYCAAIEDPDDENEEKVPIYINSRRLKENLFIETYPLYPHATDLTQLVKAAVDKFQDFRSLGERITYSNGASGPYKWITYKEVYDHVKCLAAALQSKNVKKGDMIGIFSNNCLYWHIAEFAIHLCGAIVVPISDRLGPDTDKDIINDSGVKIIIMHGTNLHKIKNISQDCLKIIMNYNTDDLPPNCIQMDEFLAEGKALLKDFKKPDISPTDPAYIVYTSSEEGPRGCVLTHRNFISAISSFSLLDASISTNDVLLSFIPLAHVYAISVELLHFVQGSAIGFYSGDMHYLSDDISTLRPTVFCGVPRVFNRLLDQFNEKVEKLSSFSRHILDLALWYTGELLKEQKTSYLLDRFVFSDVKQALGGRVRLIVIGGAPVRGEVYAFLQRVITPNIAVGYGLTETAAAGAVKEARSNDASSVGTISVGVDMKLRAVKSLSYDPLGQPPTGEILLRGPAVFKNYFKSEFERGEWFATGDIGTITNGKLQIIDQVKPLIKLSQGEYLSANQLAKKYQKARGVRAILIIADPHHSRPVAIVVPTIEFINEWNRSGITELESSQAAEQQLVENLLECAEKERLRSFEKIAGVIIETDYNAIHGLEQSSPAVKAKYSSKILDLYLRIGN